MKIIDLEGL